MKRTVKRVLKKNAIVLSMFFVFGILGFSYGPSVMRTIAIAALKSIADRFSESLSRMPMDPEDGGDVAYVCGVAVLLDWGEPVYHSVTAQAELANKDVLGSYLDTVDGARRGVKKLSEMRRDLQSNVRKELTRRYQDRRMSQPPENLNFNNFAENASPFLGSLSTCVTDEFIATVAATLQPIDFDNLQPASVDIGIIGNRTAISVVVGGAAFGDGVNGIVPGGTIVDIPIRDRSNKFKGVGNYRDWLARAIDKN